MKFDNTFHQVDTLKGKKETEQSFNSAFRDHVDALTTHILTEIVLLEINIGKVAETWRNVWKIGGLDEKWMNFKDAVKECMLEMYVKWDDCRMEEEGLMNVLVSKFLVHRVTKGLTDNEQGEDVWISSSFWNIKRRNSLSTFKDLCIWWD